MKGSPRTCPLSARHRWPRVLAPVVLCLLIATTALEAQPPPSAPRLPALVAGTRVAVAMANGDRLTGAVRLATDTELTVVSRGGAERRLSAREIDTITVTERDSVVNGILAGAAIGMAGGAGLGAAWFYGSGRYGAKPPGYERGFISGTAVLGGVVGALIGWRADAARERGDVVYRAHARP